MKKKLIPIIALGIFTMAAVSCGGKATWSFEEATKDGKLNYALLIGQIDHNDSAARTGGIREALKTRPTPATTNANTETPVKGSIELGGKTYEVNEVVHGEQKNDAGATWDQQKATTSVETWFNTYNDIDFVVSNNDGMAVGALGATNWVEGMPLFGYDSNQDALKYIKEGKMSGTVNQNAPAQAAAIYMIARNALDGVSPEDMLKSGFKEENSYGKINSEVGYTAESKAVLVNNVAVTKENVDSFMTSDITTLAEKGIKKGTTEKKKIWHSYYSATDTFLTSSMEPLFKHYAPLFNFDVTTVKSSVATDDTSNLSALDGAEGYDAYVLNMVKTTATKDYLDKIAKKVEASEANPSDVPVIFWNRQGTDDKNVVDTVNMQDARFKYIYYVGFDAIQGGQLQGQMIVDYFKDLAK